MSKGLIWLMFHALQVRQSPMENQNEIGEAPPSRLERVGLIDRRGARHPRTKG
jgi:hypothetical protein